MQSKDAQRIRDFILEHRPHVVMVGATNLHCKQLHADLAHIRDHILEHNPQWLTRSETGDVDLIYADETLAALWQTSAAAQQEMGDQPPLVRRAVSPLPAQSCVQSANACQSASTVASSSPHRRQMEAFCYKLPPFKS